MWAKHNYFIWIFVNFNESHWDKNIISPVLCRKVSYFSTENCSFLVFFFAEWNIYWMQSPMLLNFTYFKIPFSHFIFPIKMLLSCTAYDVHQFSTLASKVFVNYSRRNCIFDEKKNVNWEFFLLYSPFWIGYLPLYEALLSLPIVMYGLFANSNVPTLFQTIAIYHYNCASLCFAFLS